LRAAGVVAAGPELPLLQQVGRLPVNIPSQEAAGSLLPPGWKVWHNPLQLFACINPPFISATSNMNPQGSLHSGHFNMLLYEGLPGFIGRVQALAFLAKAETGSHLSSKSLIQEKVRVHWCRSCVVGWRLSMFHWLMLAYFSFVSYLSSKSLIQEKVRVHWCRSCVVGWAVEHVPLAHPVIAFLFLTCKPTQQQELDTGEGAREV
jgi:hypothetical protein